MKDKNKPTTAERWDQWADEYFPNAIGVDDAFMTDPVSAFHKTTWEVIAHFLPNLRGKQVLVPSSGDNQAAMALAVLGAEVTSCDISSRQIAHAKAFSEQLGLNLRFQVEDSMKLDGIVSNAYDFVYMSEGALVWLNDLPGMCENIHRVLKPGGAFINYEIHPIGRPIHGAFGKIEVVKPYDQTGPIEEDDGTKYHWRLQDILNAIGNSGLTLRRLEEMFDERDRGHFFFYSDKRAEMSQDEIDAYYDWRTNPQAALPHWFTACAVK